MCLLFNCPATDTTAAVDQASKKREQTEAICFNAEAGMTRLGKETHKKLIMLSEGMRVQWWGKMERMILVSSFPERSHIVCWWFQHRNSPSIRGVCDVGCISGKLQRVARFGMLFTLLLICSPSSLLLMQPSLICFLLLPRKSKQKVNHHCLQSFFKHRCAGLSVSQDLCERRFPFICVELLNGTWKFWTFVWRLCVENGLCMEQVAGVSFLII